jgi:hypothetical protein
LDKYLKEIKIEPVLQKCPGFRNHAL